MQNLFYVADNHWPRVKMGPKDTEQTVGSIATVEDQDSEGLGLSEEEGFEIEIPDEVFEKIDSYFDTDTLSLKDSFKLGVLIERVRTNTSEEVVAEEKITALNEIANILTIKEFGMDVAEQIEDEASKLSEHHEPEEVVAESDLLSLNEKVELYQNLLSSKLDSEKRLPISSRGLFDVEKAMERPQDLFEKEVWDWIPKLPKNDIEEACRCLAIESATASTILSLRAVEDCLRRWYEQEEGGEISKTAWGGVLQELEDIYDERDERPAVLTNLDYLRMKRNEVNHPDKSPSWSEAEATLYIVRNTISEIYRQIPDETSEE